MRAVAGPAGPARGLRAWRGGLSAVGAGAVTWRRRAPGLPGPRPGRAGRGAPPALAVLSAFSAAAAAVEAPAPKGAGRGPPAATAAAAKGPWAQLGLGPDLVEAVEALALAEPTPCQAAAVPRIAAGESVLLASHTGSGKTLAYLLPAFARLKADEAARGGVPHKPRRPRVLVLGPTRELAQQVFGVAKQVSHFSRARVGLAAGGMGVPTQAKQLDRPLDVVVGTPGRVWEHVQNSSLFLGDVQCVILDEADTMFDRGFGEDVRRLLGPLRGPAIDAQAVLATATVTAPVQRLLESALEGLVPVKTSTLHKSALNAEHEFLDVTGQDKLHALAGVLRASGSTHQVVFCNTLGSCRAAEHYLAEAGHRTHCYHGDMPVADRRVALENFQGEAGAVLVCTDLAARGLDFGRAVGHVVIFDFPLNPVDYIHRAGRTARAGAKGRITSLLAKRDLVLGRRVEEAIRNGETLEALSSARAAPPPAAQGRKGRPAKAHRGKRGGGFSIRGKPSGGGRRGAGAGGGAPKRRVVDTSSRKKGRDRW